MSAQGNDLNNYLKRCHSVSRLVIHLVFTTKYRRKLLNSTMIDQIKASVESACLKLECQLIEINGEQDHVHVLIAYPPKLAISVMINNIKSISSRALRLKNPSLTRQSKSGALWSRSYFACSAGGATIDTIKCYIENQHAPD